MNADNARALSLRVLLRCQDKDAFVQEILDQAFRDSSLSGLDRRLATQLVYGVLRRRGTLDALVKPFVSRPWEQVEPWLIEALRLGVFQLALLTQIPVHAVLYETVELANVMKKPQAKGFLNGVMRAVSRLITNDEATGPASDALPVQAGLYRRLSRPVLPDPVRAQAEYLAAGYSLPGWLVDRWLMRFGREECQRLGFWYAGPAPLWLRVNTLRGTREDLLAKFREAGLSAEAGRHPQSIRLNEPAGVRDLPGFAEGQFVVQDESAMHVASAVNPEPGWRVLDLCAAPGGKSTHLAELMRDQGTIVACDVDSHRLQAIEETIARLGLKSVQTQQLSLDQLMPDGLFDAVLLDVPCSNTGVLGRRPEVRWRIRPATITKLVPQQHELLRAGCRVVRPGGVVVYSTCSVEPEENQRVVRALLNEAPEFSVEYEKEHRPGDPADGGYLARLRRKTT